MAGKLVVVEAEKVPGAGVGDGDRVEVGQFGFSLKVIVCGFAVGQAGRLEPELGAPLDLGQQAGARVRPCRAKGERRGSLVAEDQTGFSDLKSEPQE